MAYFKPQQMKINEKWYPVAVITDRPAELDEVAEQIAEASTVAKADVAAVLMSLPSVMARLMDAGRSVHLQNIGHFRYTIAAKPGGKNTAKEVTAADIKHARIRFTPESTRSGSSGAMTRSLSEGVHWTLWKGESLPAGPEEGEEEGGESPDSIV